tara:strand:+ start:2701 stop:3048 length:348 start_codon:yes stop_codon:yes gene_type:complete
MKDFHTWLNESSEVGPIFKDSAIKEGDYVEISRHGDNFGRTMGRVIEVQKGATIFNKVDAIRVQPTDFSGQHERKINISHDRSPFWMEIPYREDPSTERKNDPVVWLLNPRWIKV